MSVVQATEFEIVVSIVVLVPPVQVWPREVELKFVILEELVECESTCLGDRPEII